MSTKKYVVIGGGGFVGKAICRELRAQGHAVVSLSRGTYPDLEEIGVMTHQVDIGQPAPGWEACFSGADGVFHTAAKVLLWGEYDSFFRTNVVGTRNVVSACRQAGVPALVFTSSPSVIADGKDLRGVNEDYPYPRRHHGHYPATKAQAEREVLDANGIDGLRTAALRPHLIWGPGDTNLIPTILERARAGRLVRVGNGKNRVDLCYIEDCVRAHILAMAALERRPEAVSGKAYFISQGDPVSLWAWVDQILEAHGLPKISRSIPIGMAQFVAAVCELFCTALSKAGLHREPFLTSLLVSEMSTDHYFDISRARDELGFVPRYTIAEAMRIAFDYPKR